MSKTLLKKSLSILDDDESCKAKVKTSKKSKIRKPKDNKKDVSEDNIKKLLMLSNFKLNDKMVKTTIERSRSRHYKLPENEDNQQQESVFTEEDFEKFAAEYNDT